MRQTHRLPEQPLASSSELDGPSDPSCFRESFPGQWQKPRFPLPVKSVPLPYSALPRDEGHLDPSREESGGR